MCHVTLVHVYSGHFPFQIKVVHVSFYKVNLLYIEIVCYSVLIDL